MSWSRRRIPEYAECNKPTLISTLILPNKNRIATLIFDVFFPPDE